MPTDPTNVATSSFDVQTGMNWNDLVDFVRYGIIQVFFGDALGFLFAMRSWIILAAAIGMLLFFVSRWFRFFNH